MKKALKIVGIILIVIAVIAVSYVAYVLIAYHRIGDTPLEVTVGKAAEANVADYTVVSYNIGFGAYESDYGFFMDGGDKSWAWSEERLDKNLKNIAKTLSEQDADIYFIQEVDIDSTRTYGVDERPYLTEALPDMYNVFAQNFDSPFLFYPFHQPHGIARSGIMTFSKPGIYLAGRVELPVESGLTKLVDLDRCYSKCRVMLRNEKNMVLYNFHLSAYTSDGAIATKQLELLLADMQSEYEKGNYCVAGGDFNKDILGDSSQYFGKADKEYTWAQPVPEGVFDGKNITLVAPLDKNDPVPSCRNADSAYHPGQLVLTIDGFLVSENVDVVSSEVIDTGFAYSDHNPVKMTLSLKG